MGVGRGGFYNYLFIENNLMRIGVHNADRIHPEWQDIEVSRTEGTFAELNALTGSF